MKSIIIIGTLPSSLINFRGDMLKCLVANGWKVYAMASNATPEEVTQIEALNIQYIDYPVERSSLNPFSDFGTYRALKKAIKTINPSVVLAYTIKPVIWGGLASRNAPQVKFIALITGLGFSFQKEGKLKSCLTHVITKLYQRALSKSFCTVFQNSDNKQVFIDRNIVSDQKTLIVNGSGVNLRHYPYNETNSHKTTFLLIARLLIDKGIAEYVEAAQNVKKIHPNVIFQIMGPQDPSPNAYPFSKINEYVKSGIIEYIPPQKDVRPYIKACQIYVLPSYHEGMPRTVLEAMSIGRPIITTHAPGCRVTVSENENGYLIPIKDSKALENAMLKMIENRKNWIDMGMQSRKFAEDKFDVEGINEKILQLCNSALD